MANVCEGKLKQRRYNRLNLDNVERVEIVKGAASTLYGSSAVGGVINIITRDSEDPWNLNVNSRFGEHNDHDMAELSVSKPVNSTARRMCNTQCPILTTYRKEM